MLAELRAALEQSQEQLAASQQVAASTAEALKESLRQTQSKLAAEAAERNVAERECRQLQQEGEYHQCGTPQLQGVITCTISTQTSATTVHATAARCTAATTTPPRASSPVAAHTHG